MCEKYSKGERTRISIFLFIVYLVILSVSITFPLLNKMPDISNLKKKKKGLS